MSYFRETNVKPEHRYRTEAERAALQVGAATTTHNRISQMTASRRNKIRIMADDQLNRKNTVRDRLRKKLAKKK